MSRRFAVSLVLIFSALVLIGAVFNLSFWLLPPEQKFAKAWRDDLDLLQKTGHFPQAWNQLASTEFTSQESQVQKWYEITNSPFTTSKQNGRYKLQILAIHFIQKYRYGVILQYSWVDLKTRDTVGEIGRTLELGIVY